MSNCNEPEKIVQARWCCVRCARQHAPEVEAEDDEEGRAIRLEVLWVERVVLVLRRWWVKWQGPDARENVTIGQIR
jgi:hypothetical protein